MAPKLIKIDLTKGEGHKHPDFNDKDQFLIKHDGTWYAGWFGKQWYGWNFGPWVNGVGVQYDKPGTNSSEWEEVYLIKEKK